MAKQNANEQKQASKEGFTLEQYDREPPLVLYKYRAFDKYAQSIFQDNEIYFSPPENFNDPFDSKLRFTYSRSKQERKRLLREWMSRCFPKLPQRIINAQVKGTLASRQDIPVMERMCDDVAKSPREEYGVFCMTEKNDNILMWAHYGDRHTGFCLAFSTAYPFFSRVRPVTYCRDLPCQDFIRYMRVRIPRVPVELATKADDWAHEQEWRIVDPAGGYGVKKYPAGALAGVILGCRMPLADREQIRRWCKLRKPRPKLYEAQEKKTEFGLDIIDIPY